MPYSRLQRLRWFGLSVIKSVELNSSVLLQIFPQTYLYTLYIVLQIADHITHFSHRKSRWRIPESCSYGIYARYSTLYPLFSCEILSI